MIPSEIFTDEEDEKCEDGEEGLDEEEGEEEGKDDEGGEWGEDEGGYEEMIWRNPNRFKWPKKWKGSLFMTVFVLSCFSITTVFSRVWVG